VVRPFVHVPGAWCAFRRRKSRPQASHQLEANRHLTLHSEDHLPPGWKERFGAWIDWTWTFVLDDLGNWKTRFIFRSRLRAGPWWVATAYLLAIVPAGFVMSRQMLRGVKARAERTTAADLLAAAQPAEPLHPR
jgi:hypothetical protein